MTAINNVSVNDVSYLALIYTSHRLIIQQTRDTVFQWDIQTPRRELKIRHAAKFEVFG